MRLAGAVGQELVAPGIGGLLQTTAGRELPLGLGGQALAGPACKHEHVVMADLHHRMVPAAVNAAAGAQWLTPAGTGHEAPPAGLVVQAHRSRGAHEHHRPGHQRRIRRARNPRWQLHPHRLPVRRALGRGQIPGLAHELGELIVGDMGAIHPEPVHLDRMGRALIGAGEPMVAAHQEAPTRDPGHARGRVHAVAQNDARRGRRTTGPGQPRRARPDGQRSHRQAADQPAAAPPRRWNGSGGS